MTRNLKGSGLDEGVSTRLLVHAGKLMATRVDPHTASRSAIAEALIRNAGGDQCAERVVVLAC